MRFQHALANAWLSVKILSLACSALFCLNLALLIGWYHAQQTVRVYIPPHIPASGLSQTANTVPASTVYGFAFYIWQRVNYWSDDGKIDYPHAIDALTPFLTPKFKQVLWQDYQDRQTHGELHDRIRHLQGANGTAFDSTAVETLGKDTWLVHLPMRLSEYMNMNGNAVKDVVLNYTLRVVRYDVSAQHNPWGLALDGFVENPERVKTYI